jgi:hypothetical protein
MGDCQLTVCQKASAKGCIEQLKSL